MHLNPNPLDSKVFMLHHYDILPVPAKPERGSLMWLSPGVESDEGSGRTHGCHICPRGALVLSKKVLLFAGERKEGGMLVSGPLPSP